MEFEKLKKAYSYYDKYGGEGYIGESVSQLEHAIQAAFLAEEYTINQKDYNQKREIYNDFVLGSFFHDIGHLLVYENDKLEMMGNYGVMEHEEIGANLMREIGFNNNICEFVRNHIKTKRYLITKNKDYYNNLSSASKKTFEYQGGFLEEKDLNEFENNPLFRFHLEMRGFDDKAKSTDEKLLRKIATMDKINYLSKFINRLK